MCRVFCVCQTRLKLSCEVDECKPLGGGVRREQRAPPGAGHARQPGRAVQVDPMKPTLKPPGTKRLKLKCDVPLSSFAFKFNSRRVNQMAEELHTRLHAHAAVWGGLEAGAYTRPPLSSS